MWDFNGGWVSHNGCKKQYTVCLSGQGGAYHDVTVTGTTSPRRAVKAALGLGLTPAVMHKVGPTMVYGTFHKIDLKAKGEI